MAATKREARAALRREPETTDDGQVLCQVCGRAFGSLQALGCHQHGHRREAGLAPPKVRKLLGPKEVVTCEIEGCGARVQFISMRTHLRRVHGLSLSDAAFRARALAERVAAERVAVKAAAPLPAVVEEASPPPLMTDLLASEAVAGILNAARRDGLVPTALLPAVTDLVRHTEVVLDELARLTNGNGRP